MTTIPEDLYEIKYNADTHLFDVLFQGAWIDKVACYYDGHTAVEAHRAILEADEASAPERAPCDGHYASFVEARGYAVYLDWDTSPPAVACPVCGGWALDLSAGAGSPVPLAPHDDAHATPAGVGGEVQS